jgi:hypothetical protein
MNYINQRKKVHKHLNHKTVKFVHLYFGVQLFEIIIHLNEHDN